MTALKHGLNVSSVTARRQLAGCVSTPSARLRLWAIHLPYGFILKPDPREVSRSPLRVLA